MGTRWGKGWKRSKKKFKTDSMYYDAVVRGDNLIFVVNLSYMTGHLCGQALEWVGHIDPTTTGQN